jgi:hypothetical protein
VENAATGKEEWESVSRPIGLVRRSRKGVSRRTDTLRRAFFIQKGCSK